MNGCSIPLSLAGTGKVLKVTEVTAGWGLRRRLAELGLTPGVPVTIMSGCRPGPLLIDVRGSRLSLGFGVAQKIMVKESEIG
jgi:ferrous iron transport protein A